MFVLAAADSAGIPIVGGVDALLITIAAQRPALAYFAALCAIAGSVIGSAVLFAIARKGGEVFLARHTTRGFGKRLHAWFERYGLATIFIPAISPLPMPMKVPVFCAGALDIRWPAFLVTVVCARVIRYFALAYLAQRFGSETLHFLTHHWGPVLGVAVSLSAAVLIALRLINKRRALAG